jgi:hypothetical protein
MAFAIKCPLRRRFLGSIDDGLVALRLLPLGGDADVMSVRELLWLVDPMVDRFVSFCSFDAST